MTIWVGTLINSSVEHHVNKHPKSKQINSPGGGHIHIVLNTGRVWRYQRGIQNSYIEDKQTTQWPPEKVQKDKQRSTKHTHKT